MRTHRKGYVTRRRVVSALFSVLQGGKQPGSAGHSFGVDSIRTEFVWPVFEHGSLTLAEHLLGEIGSESEFAERLK